jgi:hypothetical protein
VANLNCVCQCIVLFSILGPVIHLTHTSPGHLLSHLRKLAREGESLLASPPFLTPLDEVPWDARVWKCLDKIAAPDAFAGATQLDNADVGKIDLLDFDRPSRSALEGDELLRRRIRRRLVTLASVIEKVEALAESPTPRPIQFPSPRRRPRDPNS